MKRTLLSVFLHRAHIKRLGSSFHITLLRMSPERRGIETNPALSRRAAYALESSGDWQSQSRERLHHDTSLKWRPKSNIVAGTDMPHRHKTGRRCSAKKRESVMLEEWFQLAVRYKWHGAYGIFPSLLRAQQSGDRSQGSRLPGD